MTTATDRLRQAERRAWAAGKLWTPEVGAARDDLERAYATPEKTSPRRQSELL